MLADLPINLLAVGEIVAPGMHQVLRAERRVATEELGVAGSELSGTHKGPNRDPSTDDAWLAARDSGGALDPREGGAEILKQLAESSYLLPSVEVSDGGKCLVEHGQCALSMWFPAVGNAGHPGAARGTTNLLGRAT